MDDEHKTAKEEIKERIRELKENLMHSLQYDANAKSGVDETLQNQAKALDAAFRRLLGGADERYEDMANYRAAFKAQDQFRHTAIALNSLKNKETDDAKK